MLFLVRFAGITTRHYAHFNLTQARCGQWQQNCSRGDLVVIFMMRVILMMMMIFIWILISIWLMILMILLMMMVVLWPPSTNSVGKKTLSFFAR